MAEADVRGGSMAAEGVEVAPADQNQLRHSESGGAAGERSDVVPLRYVVNNDVALVLFRLRLLHRILHTAAAADGRVAEIQLATTSFYRSTQKRFALCFLLKPNHSCFGPQGPFHGGLERIIWPNNTIKCSNLDMKKRGRSASGQHFTRFDIKQEK